MNRQIKCKELFQNYRNELKGLYSSKEIDSILHILFEEYLDITKVAMALEKSKNVQSSALDALEEAVAKIKSHMPVQYVTGKAWFRGYEFKVNKSVLIPRQETELLVDWLIDDIDDEGPGNNCQILDIGTGSGCIAIALKKKLDQCRISAVDKSNDALQVAKENAQRLNTEILFSLLDLEDSQTWQFYSKFNRIVSNPPYVLESEKELMDKNVVDYEPEGALYVDDNDPLHFYKLIVQFSKKFLKKEGRLYLEVNEKMSRKVASLLAFSGFCDVNIKHDLNDKERFVRASFR